ncbi:hypothetical protein PG39_02310 [Salmonella enterica subsp. diarizonae]|uniref:Uncharacterized protein n=1 Tax=Salmonella diarizonae TaxID=59204 RepID=A0A5U3D4Z6_SALDZ|nr:hypothetical protein [Salmonella enterica subsp. diarizonae]ECO1714550.1 hypothetical protein [Salmonella enterica]EBP3693205.1 hypothetical protein [Salmonella enterica subsp. diarizonae]EBQ6942470.1 hypothetical protein [Salmonella enterica subsp. diarizonae]ECO1820426.1 hypothetical protein [Salmonella enterica]
MSKTPTPTITITVSGPTGSGKSRVLAVIADALKLIHSDCIIEAPDVKAEKEMCGNDYTAWHKPRSGTIFKLKEVNLPGSLQKTSIRGMSHSEVMAWFEEYGFRDKVGHPLTLNLDFRELLYLAQDHQDKPDREITFDDLVDRTVPVHIQPLMNRLGISFEEGTETDLQPVIDLANWANAARAGVGYIPPEGWQCRSETDTTEPECAVESDKDLIARMLSEAFDTITAEDISKIATKLKAISRTQKDKDDFATRVREAFGVYTSHNENNEAKPSITELRKYMVSELVELMSPENQSWYLPDAAQAVVAALITLYDRDLIFMELRKFINPSCN